MAISNGSKKNANQAEWTDDHQASFRFLCSVSNVSKKRRWRADHVNSELYLFLIELGIQNRPALYARAGLANVNGNGGNKINKKLLPVLRTLEVAAGKPGAVQNAIDNLKAAKAAGVAEGSPSKAAGGKAKKGGASAGAGGSKMSPGKKRKVDEVAGDVKVEVRAVKDEEDELDESE